MLLWHKYNLVKEQLFLKDPYFMQWLKLKYPNELAGMAIMS